MVTKKLFLKNSDEVIRLLGSQDENLRRIEQAHGVQIFVRQGGQLGDFSLSVRGPAGKVERALSDLDTLREKQAMRTTESCAAGSPAAPSSETVYVTYQGKPIKPRSEHQKKFVDCVNRSDLAVAIGPAGTGKTFLSVACALRALQSGKVNRIVLTRPVVEAGERLGFLPGDLYEKINPYLRPLYDSFFYMIGPERFRFLREEETIEIVPLAYMRGRTIDDAFIILDEAQNSTSEQMKMFLTRLGADSKMVVSGDVTQIDLERKNRSGLLELETILQGVEGVKLLHFDEHDVVRHDLVKRIIRAYDSKK